MRHRTRNLKKRGRRLCFMPLILINPGTLILAGLYGGIVAMVGVVVFIIIPRLPI